jgi:hypothetical protein
VALVSSDPAGDGRTKRLALTQLCSAAAAFAPTPAAK